MATIEWSYSLMQGDFWICDVNFRADLDVSLNETGDPYVSSVTDICLIDDGVALPVSLDSDNPVLATLCREIQEHCESDESILRAALQAQADPRDTAGDAKYREHREAA